MRLKAKCSSCKTIIYLFFDEKTEDDVGTVRKGEYVEHKCPACGEWAAFEALEDGWLEQVGENLWKRRG